MSMTESSLPDARMAAIAHARGENITDPRPVKLTVDDLEWLDRNWSEVGQHHSTELIDGRIYHTPARYGSRVKVVMTLFEAMRNALSGLEAAPAILTRCSVEMPPYDLPLPDLVLTYEPEGAGFIPAQTVPLIVEVADGVTDFFLRDKLRCYAKHRIPEYWVADVNARMIHQMWAPAGNAYADRREVTFGQQVVSERVERLLVKTIGI